MKHARRPLDGECVGTLVQRDRILTRFRDSRTLASGQEHSYPLLQFLGEETACLFAKSLTTGRRRDGQWNDSGPVYNSTGPKSER